MKKIIALLLAVLMLLSVAPVAFAEEAADETTTAVADDAYDNTDEDVDADFTASSLFGDFFVRIGELLEIIINFLSNLFNGTGDKDLGNL